MADLARELEMHRRAADFIRLARLAVQEAREESRRLGVANVHFANGRTYYELPNGEYTTTPPPGYQEALGRIGVQ
jgi:hypothetical protein